MASSSTATTTTEFVEVKCEPNFWEEELMGSLERAETKCKASVKKEESSPEFVAVKYEFSCEEDILPESTLKSENDSEPSEHNEQSSVECSDTKSEGVERLSQG